MVGGPTSASSSVRCRPPRGLSVRDSRPPRGPPRPSRGAAAGRGRATSTRVERSRSTGLGQADREPLERRGAGRGRAARRRRWAGFEQHGRHDERVHDQGDDRADARSRGSGRPSSSASTTPAVSTSIPLIPTWVAEVGVSRSAQAIRIASTIDEQHDPHDVAEQQVRARWRADARDDAGAPLEPLARTTG